MGRIWAITSGSGGAGKTTLSVALSVAAAKHGCHTVLLDTSGVSRSSDLMLGIENVLSIDLNDVLSGQMELESAKYAVSQHKNLWLVNASLSNSVHLGELSGMMLALEAMCDIVIIDLPNACLLPEHGVMTKDDEYILVTRPDDASVRSCDSLIQKLRGSEAGVSLVVNHMRRDRVKKGLQYNADSIAMILDCPVLSSISEDDLFLTSSSNTKNGQNCSQWSNHSSIREIINRLLER